jgi:hypothetical protein
MATVYVPILLAKSPLAAMRSAPTTIEVDAASLHERSRHAFRDDGRRHAVTNELPRRQTRALQERAGFVGEHLHHLALLAAARITP